MAASLIGLLILGLAALVLMLGFVRLCDWV